MNCILIAITACQAVLVYADWLELKVNLSISVGLRLSISLEVDFGHARKATTVDFFDWTKSKLKCYTMLPV